MGRSQPGQKAEKLYGERDEFVHAIGRQEHKPNIVLILTDNLGYGELGIYGNLSVANSNLSGGGGVK